MVPRRLRVGRERSNHGEIQYEFQEKGGESDARVQARQAEERESSEAGQEPQAGHRHRAVGGAALRCACAEPQIVFAQCIEPQWQEQKRVQPERQEPKRIQPEDFVQQIIQPQIHQPEQEIG